MTSVHMRLLGCLEQYQTAEHARSFRRCYIDTLLLTLNV